MAVETKTIGIYVFNDVEALDFAGPYEVMTTAGRVHARMRPGTSTLFKVVTVGRSRQAITARAGLRIEPDCSIADHPPLDCLIVPGGVITDELDKPDVISWIDQQAGMLPITASVCTGAFLLAKTGRLNGLDVITHWEDIDDLKRMFPEVSIRLGARWVDHGKIVTSAGISAGIDMSLHLVERFGGRTLAERTARQLEFDWKENR